MADRYINDLRACYRDEMDEVDEEESDGRISGQQAAIYRENLTRNFVSDLEEYQRENQ